MLKTSFIFCEEAEKEILEPNGEASASFQMPKPLISERQEPCTQ